MNLTSKLISLAVSGIMLFSCQPTNSDNENDLGITIPPTKSMDIPNMFAQNTTAKVSATQTKIAYGLAGLAVAYWSTVIKTALTPPVVLFALAHTQQPTVMPDDSGLQWSLANADFSAVLTAELKNGGVYWKMVVTGGRLNDFTWFDGTANLEGKTCGWTFYDTAGTVSSNVPAITFDYSLTNSKEELHIEIVKTGDINNGNYLTWKAESEDLSLTGYDNKIPKTTIIYMNAITEAGYIEVTDTGNKVCWDTKLKGHEDIACATQP